MMRQWIVLQLGTRSKQASNAGYASGSSHAKPTATSLTRRGHSLAPVLMAIALLVLVVVAGLGVTEANLNEAARPGYVPDGAYLYNLGSTTSFGMKVYPAGLDTGALDNLNDRQKHDIEQILAVAFSGLVDNHTLDVGGLLALDFRPLKSQYPTLFSDVRDYYYVNEVRLAAQAVIFEIVDERGDYSHLFSSIDGGGDIARLHAALHGVPRISAAIFPATHWGVPRVDAPHYEMYYAYIDGGLLSEYTRFTIQKDTPDPKFSEEVRTGNAPGFSFGDAHFNVADEYRTVLCATRTTFQGYADVGWVSPAFIRDRNAHKLTETVAPAGFERRIDEMVVRVSEAGGDPNLFVDHNWAHYLVFNEPIGGGGFDPRTGWAVIYKVDERGRLLAGADLAIYQDNYAPHETPLATYTTDGDAWKIELPMGTYELVETSAPDNYTIADPVSFTLVVPDEAVEVTMVNRRDVGDEPVIQAHILKELRMAPSVSTPSETFVFTFEPVRFDPFILENPIAAGEVTLFEMPRIPDAHIHIDQYDASLYDNGVIRFHKYSDDFLNGVGFPEAGTYIYRVSESAGTATPGMAYSPSQYLIHIEVTNQPSGPIATAIDITTEVDDPAVPAYWKDSLYFVNEYEPVENIPGDLIVTKRVRSERIDTTQQFVFSILISDPHRYKGFPIEGVITNEREEVVGYLTIPNGQEASFALAHDQKLTVTALHDAVVYRVIEAAIIDYAATVTIHAGGDGVIYHVVNSSDNLALSTQMQQIRRGSNDVNFDNTFQEPVVAGVDTTALPASLVGIFAGFVASALVLVNLRRNVTGYLYHAWMKRLS